MRSSVIVYQRQGHVCVYFILWFQRNERDWIARLTTAATSTRHDFKTNIASDRLLFNTNKQNEYSATQLERFHLLPAYVCTAKCYKNTLFDDVGVAFTGGYPICPLTRQAQMHVSDSYLIFSTYEWGLKPIWEYRKPCDFFLLTRSWAISDLCHMGG